MDADRRHRLGRNVSLLRAIRAVEFFLLMIPVLVVYYRAHGMSMADVMLLQAIFSAAIVVVEVPSGYCSDVLGRRRTLLLGTSMLAVGWIVYCFVDTFTGFLAAELILGTGMSFVSGTDSAMLYDTLLELGTAEASIREEGRQLSYGHFAESVSGLLGGALAGIALVLPLYVQAGVMLALPVLAWYLVEPAEHRRSGRTAGIVDIVAILRRVVVGDPSLRWMLVTASLLGGSTLTFVWMLQPWMVLADVPLWLFGAVWSGYMLIVGVAAVRAHRVYERYGPTGTVALLTAGVSLAYVLLGTAAVWWLLVAPVAFYVARGVSNPVFVTVLNARTSSSERATVLSVRQLGVRLVFIVVGPLIGMLTDATSLLTALTVCGIGFGVLTGAAVLRWRAVQRTTVNGTAA